MRFLNTVLCQTAKKAKKKTFDELVFRINVQRAQLLVKSAIETYGNDIYVACSFGKDSMIITHLARSINPNIKIVFCNTLCEFPETIHFKQQITRNWNLNLIELRPYKNMTFWKCADKYGLPIARKVKAKRHFPRCCWYLKEKPAEIFYKSVNAKAVITGLRAKESRNRALFTIRMDKSEKKKDGITFCARKYYAKGWQLWKINPIIKWSNEEVWEYIRRFNIPTNEVYTKWGGIYDRCGCLPCTGYISWKERLSVSHPKLFKMLIEKYGDD